MSSSTTKRLGDFEIIRELGRGGMGVVFEARQVSLNRKVALKVLASTLGLTPRAVERFQREAEAAAKLHHTNIVPVYATGEQDGAHFYAMELIAGPSTPGLSSSSLQSGSACFDSVARMMAEVADALDYAHKQGVVHRDVKPSNLLVSPQGRLGLNDFGLARMLEQPGMTMTGEFVGTPAYMSPEQITSGRIPLDHRTDIYSLGATLYEILTLQTPFNADRRDQMLAQIIQKDPAPPRKLNKNVPRDLETICLKALDKDPDKRYQTAGQMAEDLRRFVNRFAILAKRAGPIEHVRKWVRRHPALASALVVVALALATAGVFAYQKYRVDQQHIAERQRLVDQVRVEKRDRAMDKAMAAAMGGDKIAADNAVGEAEQLGASTGQVRLLRGLVAYCNGDAVEAIRHLKMAREIMGDSAAVCALLVLAFGSESDFIGFAGEMDQLEKLPVRTAEDHLFKAWAIGATLDPIRGLGLLDEQTQWRSTGIGRLIRAALSQAKANLSGNLQDAEAAAKDAQTACDLLQGNPYALANRAFASLLLAYIHRRAGRDADSQRELDRAGEDVRALKAFPTCTYGWFAQYVFLCRKGQPGAALELCGGALKQGQQNFLMTYLVEEYQKGEKDLVREHLDRAKPLDEKWGLALLNAWALLESPEGAATVRRFYADITAKPKSFGTALWPIPIAYLLGDPDLAKATAIEVRGKFPRTPWRGGWYSDIANFCAGDLTVQQFERITGVSLLNQCEGQFFIGMKFLAEGDRRSAAEHFRKSVDTPLEVAEDYVFSKAFLERLEKDPNWPPWIPKKEDDKK
jgi:hypothetical protein